MHMNLRQVQIKSLSSKPSLVHLGIVYSSQSPTGGELPRVLISAQTPRVKEMKQSHCFNVLEMRETNEFKATNAVFVNNMPCKYSLNKSTLTYEHQSFS